MINSEAIGRRQREEESRIQGYRELMVTPTAPETGRASGQLNTETIHEVLSLQLPLVLGHHPAR